MTTKANMIKEIQDFNSQGKTKAQIEGYLSFTYDMKVKECKDLVQEVLGKGSIGSADWSETITYIRENYGKISKAELIEGMMRISGGAKSSMNHAYNYIKFAQEFAKQEVESQK